MSKEDVAEHVELYLRQTRPWLVFVAILGFLGALLLVVRGASFALSPPLPMFGAAFGLVYVAIGLVYGGVAAVLLQQALAIDAVRVGGGVTTGVEDVLRHHRNFWRLTRGMALALIALYGGIMLAAMAGLAGGR